MNNKTINLKLKMKKYNTSFLLIFLISVLSFLSSDLSGQSIGRVGTTAASFLKIGVGGRALGMGEAYTTIAEDVTGMYWNPAGIAKLDKISVMFNHYDYIADIYYDFGGAAIPIEGLGTLGAFIGHLGMPDIERTSIQYPEGTGEKVSAGSIVIGVSFARALTDRFSFGANVKYIREDIWHSSASSFAFDAGVLYTAFFKNLKIGMSISNFGSDMKMEGRDMLVQHDINSSFEGNNDNINSHLDTDNFPLPILFRVGLSANIAKDFFELQDHDWIISVDAIHPNDNKEYLNMGTEVKIFNLLALRAGYRQLMLEDREGGLTFGFGINYELMNVDFKLDYANVDFGRLDHQNKFSIILSF